MLELLSAFTLKQIIAFLIMSALAIRGVLDFYDWAKNKYKEKFNKDYDKLKEQEDYEEHCKSCELQYEELKRDNEELEKNIKDLIESLEKKFNYIENQLIILSSNSRNDIKAWIVDIHHKCVKEQQIDDFTKDIVERRFEDYKTLGGNSYIKNLVQEIRELPLK